MSGLTNASVAQQVQALLDTQKRQTDYLTAWLGGSPTGGPNNDGRYPFVDLAGVEILVPAPATFNNMTSGPAALSVAAKVAAEVARDLAQGHADRANDQRVLAEAARGAAIDARNLAQEHRSHAATHEARAEYWANLAQGSGQSSSEDREIVEQLAAETADNAALAAQDADDAAASAAQAATFNPALYDLKTDALAASRLTGLIDVARIPILPSQRQFMSSGGLANLTAAQQSEIGQGSLVTTTDGSRWVYSGAGSKTVEASYIQLADLTPEISNVNGLQTALNSKANVASPTFSGTLAAPIILAQAQMIIDAAAGSERAMWLKTSGSNRWRITSNASAETGGNAGSNYSIDRYDDAGARIGTAFSISRNSGAVTLGGPTTVAGTLSVNGAVAAHSYGANTSLFYPDGNHSVIKTGAAGGEKYWRFDANGFLYSLNGGLYANQHIQTMTFFIAGESSGDTRTEIQKGWAEIRHPNGPYIDLSKDGTTDFHARVQYQSDNYFVLTANGARLIHRPDGRVNAESSDGVQSGEILTLNGAEQLISTKQLTFASRQNPQDGGAYAPLEVRGEGGGYGAWMKFHRPGAYGTYFGMFEDGKWGFGGWSTGATIYEFWTSKNFDPGSRMERYNDGWIHTRDNNERFYFATNGRTYMRSRGGFEWRDNGDIWQAILSNDGVFETKNTISTLGNNIKIRGNSPTLYFKDTDNRSAMIHVNSNRFYVLRGNGNDQEGWSTVPNKGWPMELDLETNHATFGGSIYLNSEWLRIHGNTGIYWETWAGGWFMSDSSWMRTYNGKGVYTPGQIRGGTVVGESDRRLKANIATITDATEKVEALTGVTFDWIASGKAGMGFIAQDFEEIVPALVHDDGSEDAIKAVEYGPVVALLVEALKETNARVALLEGRV